MRFGQGHTNDGDNNWWLNQPGASRCDSACMDEPGLILDCTAEDGSQGTLGVCNIPENESGYYYTLFAQPTDGC